MIVAICDKCSEEMSRRSEVRSHPDGITQGDYCVDCHEDLMTDAERTKALFEWLNPRAAGPAYYDLLKAVLKTPEKAASNCHWAARELVRRFNAKPGKGGYLALPKGWVARVIRGRYGINQHSWLEVFDGENFHLLDPSSWQFHTDCPPALQILDPIKSERKQSPHDTCGWHLTNNMSLQVDPKLLDRLSAEQRQDWRRTHLHPAHLGDEAQTVQCLKQVERRNPSMMPYETGVWFGITKDPDKDVHTRGLKPWKNAHLRR